MSVVYDDFIKAWREGESDKNLCDDYFARAMKAYAKQYPRYQRGTALPWTGGPGKR